MAHSHQPRWLYVHISRLTVLTLWKLQKLPATWLWPQFSGAYFSLGLLSQLRNWSKSLHPQMALLRLYELKRLIRTVCPSFPIFCSHLICVLDSILSSIIEGSFVIGYRYRVCAGSFLHGCDIVQQSAPYLFFWPSTVSCLPIYSWWTPSNVRCFIHLYK